MSISNFFLYERPEGASLGGRSLSPENEPVVLYLKNRKICSLTQIKSTCREIMSFNDIRWR